MRPDIDYALRLGIDALIAQEEQNTMEFAQRLIATRRGTFLISVLAAVLAGALILVYVNRYRSSVKTEGAPVTVLVARQDIPKGTAGNVIASTGLYSATTIRQSQLLDGAYSDPSTLRGKVTTHEIFANAQLSASDFAGGATSVASSLTDRERVISIPLDAAHGLIGAIQPGDRVDVFVGFNVVPVGADGNPVAGGQSRPVLRRVMGNVPVVSVPGKSGGGLGGGSSATNIDLKVRDNQAAELAFASDNGKIWLVLRPSSGAKASPPSLVTVDTLLLGVSPVTELRQFGGRR
jgi:pilus assembly protein CpaB